MGCRRRGTALSENRTDCGKPGEDDNRPTPLGRTKASNHKDQVANGEHLVDGKRADQPEPSHFHRYFPNTRRNKCTFMVKVRKNSKHNTKGRSYLLVAWESRGVSNRTRVPRRARWMPRRRPLRFCVTAAPRDGGGMIRPSSARNGSDGRNRGPLQDRYIIMKPVAER